MNTAMTTRTQWLAGVFAVLATLLTVGGPLALAEHYARSGASGDASGYYANGHARRIVCSDNGIIRTTFVLAQHGVINT